MKLPQNALSRLGILLALLLTGFTPAALADAEYIVTASKTFSGAFKPQEPIDVNLEVSGVRLGSVFFDEDKIQAFIILNNRTPIAVNPKVGVSLFDAKGKLLATGIDASSFSFTGDKISAGDQKNVELAFGKFINDFKDVASFQLVFSLGKDKQPPPSSKPAPTSSPY